MNGHNRFIGILVMGLTILLVIMMCRDVRPPIVTPTLAISETPSITPMPPTSTPTLVVTADVSPLTATATAVTATPPPDSSVTAVAPSPTPDHLQEMTSTAVPPSLTPTSTAITGDIDTPPPISTVLQATATEKSIVIVPGVTYWDTSKAEYGKFEGWKCLKARNGWHERRLPVGEVMMIPKECE